MLTHVCFKYKQQELILSKKLYLYVRILLFKKKKLLPLITDWYNLTFFVCIDCLVIIKGLYILFIRLEEFRQKLVIIFEILQQNTV